MGVHGALNGEQWSVGVCKPHTSTLTLLQLSSWSPPERFICPKQAVTCLGKFPPFLMVALFSTPMSSLTVSCFPFSPQTKFSFLSLSFQPYTVAISSFQPSSATPTSWLTHFCSEVTGFLADFQRAGLTPKPLSTSYPPRRGTGCANCECLAY